MDPARAITLDLLRNKLTLALAESCTGGLLAGRITDIPGSSAVFTGGMVAYDNGIKTRFLGVPPAMVRKYGAVCEPVARLMAENVRKLLKTDLGLAITGIAGPSGGTRAKPVGLVFIAVSNGRETLSQEFRFKGTRAQNRNAAVKAALDLLHIHTQLYCLKPKK